MNTIEIINRVAKNKGINVDLSVKDLNNTLKESKIDSLAAMTLIVAIEEELNILIADEDLIRVRTLNDLVNAINKCQTKNKKLI